MAGEGEGSGDWEAVLCSEEAAGWFLAPASRATGGATGVTGPLASGVWETMFNRASERKTAAPL